ncbi:DUF3558 domain-containing protein [Streptomyces peucetius]|uniref:DUF3558 domain-containing protein n=1 Tax=Streptomyces peucetius TaxID=1950 RepID=A0ABY6I9J8_STRPE|nr:DUF3558 domain-containing protein [Streptomyces peucetius]UYQ63674.1 DUF3558 domain-containing protein [Streptomyces peucetius]
MQRKAYVPSVAALLTALVTGCTTGSGAEGSDIDAKAEGAASPAAAPGKYRTLLEPCGSVERSTLRDLLPGTATLPEDQQQKVLRGTAGVTYDTDRRVACSWQGDSPNASHKLRVDFERVVSYDPAVSDDARAQEVFAKKQSSASVPIATAPPEEPSGEERAEGDDGSPSATMSPAGGGETDGTARPGASTDTAADSATSATPAGPSSGAPATTGLEPRVVEGLGDAAFIDDVLGRAGSTAQRRTVSVVFRTSNVIVTVVYGEQPALSTKVPDSKELQDKAQSLARKLAEQFDE